MKRIRIGNDFVFLWTIGRNGFPEDLSAITNPTLVVRVLDKIKTAPFEIVGSSLLVEFTPTICDTLGVYNLEFSYELPDPALQDLERKCKVDVDAFQIVPKTSQADCSVEYSVMTDLAIALKGDKGDSSYKVWLDEGHSGTIDDYFAYLQQPATDAAEIADEAATLANEKASLADDAANLANEVASHPQKIQTGTWWYWDVDNDIYVDSGIAATPYENYLQFTEDDPPLDEEAWSVYSKEQGDYAKEQGDYAKGIGDSYDSVKLNKTEVNLYNITLAVPLTAGQYYTSTTARAAVPVEIRKRGMELLYETAPGVWYKERFVGENVSTWTTVTDWEVVPTKSYVDTGINNALGMLSENWVGVIVDPSLSCSEPAPKSTVVAYRATELQRTGNLNYHKAGKSRIFNAFYPAIVNRATKQVAWRLDKNNPSLKDDGSPSVPDWTIHNICIVIPDLYRRIVLLDGTQDGRYEIRYDIAPFDGATLFHEESYHSIGDASMDRTSSHLVSVISNDVRFRGGGNQSAWDAQWRSQLGTPLTDTSRTNFELYANNAGWQTMNIYDWTMFSELAMLYFANTNIQLDYTSVLTSEGYPQGGLGAGNTTWISKRWDGHCVYYPIDKVGEGFMSVGCNVGVKSKTLSDYYRGATTSVAANKLIATGHFSASAGWLSSYIGYTIRNISTGLTATIVAKDSDDQLSLSADIFTATAQIFQIDGVSFTYDIPVFFGLEHLYGHLGKFISGINLIIQAINSGGRSMAYVNPDWATRSAVNVDSYQYVGDIPRDNGYIKTLFPGWNIVKSNTGGSSTTYMSDHVYVSVLPSSGQAIMAFISAGHASDNMYAGFHTLGAHLTPESIFPSYTARLRAKKPKN